MGGRVYYEDPAKRRVRVTIQSHGVQVESEVDDGRQSGRVTGRTRAEALGNLFRDGAFRVAFGITDDDLRGTPFEGIHVTLDPVAKDDPADLRRRKLVEKLAMLYRLGASPHLGEATAAFRKAAELRRRDEGVLTKADRANLADIAGAAAQRFVAQHGPLAVHLSADERTVRV